MKKLHSIAPCLAILVALSGCASNQGATGSISPIAAQADDFKVTVAQGAVAGALVGGLAGALTGNGDSKRILAGALIGGAVGTGGALIIAGQKQSYANKEDALNAVADDGRQRNAKLASILTTTDQVIAQRRTELQRLQTSVVDKQEKIKAQKALLADLEADKAALDQAVASAREHGQQLDSNISELKRQFPEDKNPALEQVAGEYHRNAAALEQKPSEVFRMIDETSRIKVES